MQNERGVSCHPLMNSSRVALNPWLRLERA
jgi:hypothetical protein